MTQKPPKIWILASPHTGDNTQLFAVAESLGWPFEVKHLNYNPANVLMRIMPISTLRGLDVKSRQQISEPYPELIICAGHATEAIALWLKKKAKSKLVYVGTPQAALDVFDLIITTPQYGLPQRANILHLDLPMHKIVPEKLRDATELWQKKLNRLKRPYTAVVLGGASGPYSFDGQAALRLAKLLENQSGSLLISTSARTPLATATALQNALTKPNYFHHWSKGQSENPFLAFLGLADQFVVTADSISMLSEAIATGKPVAMFDTENGAYAMNDGGMKIGLWGRTFYATLFRFAMRFGPRKWTRDLRTVHHQLQDTAQAHWLGSSVPKFKPRQKKPAVEQATARIRNLFKL